MGVYRHLPAVRLPAQLRRPLPSLYLTMQFLDPASDITAGGWTSSLGGALYAAVSEIVPRDSDYIYSGSAPVSDTCEVKLSPGLTPADLTNEGVSYRIGGSGDGSRSCDVKLVCGTTVIRTWSHASLGALVTFNRQLSSAEAATITDYSDLRLRFIAN